MRIALFACLSLGVSVAACSSPADPTTTSTAASSSSSSSAAGGAGGAATSGDPTSSSAASGSGGGAAACTPTPGSKAIDVGCDSIRIAVLAHTGGKTRAAIHGRLFSTPDACIRIDSVDVVRDDKTVVQSFPVSGVALKSDDDAAWAEGDAVAELEKPCSSDSPRVEAFSMIVKGTTDGGTFTSECGTITGGSSWPPRVLLTCHEDLSAPPLNAYADVTTNSQPMFTSTTLRVSFPESTKVTAMDPTIHLIPVAWMSAPIAPFDATGWMGTVGASNGFLSADLHLTTDPFGTTLCPTPPAMPDPMMIPPPLFLARTTGLANGVAFSSEVYVLNCMRIAM
jgi:hypothetical protein